MGDNGSKALAVIAVVLTCGVQVFAQANSGQANPTSAAPNTSVAPNNKEAAVFKQYCLGCHNARTRSGGLVIDTADLTDVPAHADVFEKVIRKLSTATMPPPGLPQPDKAASDMVVALLEKDIDSAAAAHPHPGRTEAFHRLNRIEYRNAIRDMLALEIDPAAILPADDQSYGFDNIAGVLKMSPTLLERYMGAARDIATLAIGVSKRPPTAETFQLRSDLSQYDQIEGLPFGTRGGTSISYNFAETGEYDFKLELLDLFAGAQIKEPHQLELSIDGVQVKVFTLGPRQGAGSPMNSGLLARTSVTAGPHVITATFFKKTDALPESVRKPFARPHGEGDFLLYAPHLGAVTIRGPFNAQPALDTPTRKKVFTCKPATPDQETACARQIFAGLARRAYRRPVSASEVDTLIAFYKEGRATGGNFDAGVEKALRALLMSPDFLYRVELDPPKAAPGSVYRLSDLELASRLSFFLWSSIPDEELIDLASKGKLNDPAVFEHQVVRMLRDSRSSALADNFAGQWLRLRNVLAATPDDVLFPNFNDNLRHDMVTETELFFNSMLKDNRSVMDLLSADYTYVNERLAKFYGIPGVYGNEFRRVKVADENRRGLLGQASILTVTSLPDRTSPVGRGKWILENILGTPPPPPPPNAGNLKDNASMGKILSMRERMAIHRANPACATCHLRMDPLGFGLENFDAVGRWRTIAESGQPVDPTGTTPDGAKFQSPAELRQLLTRNPQQFVTVVTEKLLIYSLGRGLEYQDAPAVRQIVRGAAANKYSFDSLILNLVRSAPFTMRNAPAASSKQLAAIKK